MDLVSAQLPGMLPRLWRFALRLTRNTHDAEDLLQRACVRALERRAQWKPHTAMHSWLFAVMHSIWLNDMRSQQLRARCLSPQSTDGDLDWVADPAAVDPSSTLFFRELVAAVQALPDAQRSVMLLVAVEGLSYQEAADTLDIPIGTVMSRLFRARQTMGATFGQQPSSRALASQGAKR